MDNSSEQDSSHLKPSKEEIHQRLHATKVRQGLNKRLSTILSDQLDSRLTGLRHSHPTSSPFVADWQQRLKTARLQQDHGLIQAIESEYMEWLISHDFEEFWYKESDAGDSIVMKHYKGLSNALQKNSNNNDA